MEEKLYRTTSLCGLSVVLLGLSYAIPAFANPQHGTVAAGSAVIQQSGNRVDIHQHTNKAVIDWRSFDIAPNEHTQFHQPSSNATALNRINSQNPTRIMGSLQANGNVVLINPNGVFFGKGSKVDVNSLIATSADIDNHQFMQGNLNFDKPGNPNAAIINEGTITARQAGLVGLVAPHVENRGIIEAKLGKVHLASGDTMAVDLYGDGLYRVAVSDKVTSQSVSNSGRISGEGATIALTAAKGRQIVDSLITVSGEIDAPTIQQKAGKIIIGGPTDSPKTNSTVRLSGKVSASGKAQGTKGGQITVTGDKVALEKYAVVDVSGHAGGGTVKIGGDFQGKGATPTARKTYIGPNAAINVNASHSGDGGTAIIWSDDSTQFYGTLSARGSSAGKGGFAEVSGKRYLDFLGSVDLSGKSYGTLLLDPATIDIVAGAANPAEFADDTIAFAENSSGVSTLGATTLATRLSANANVILQADNTINVNAAVTSAGSGDLTIETGAGGAININAAVNTNTGSMTLISDQIAVGASLTSTDFITIRPKTPSTDIGLGGGSGGLSLLDAELLLLNAGTLLTIGDSATGTGDVDLNSWDLSTKTYSTEIYGNDIDIGGVTMGTTGGFLAYAKNNGADVADMNISIGPTKSAAGTSSLILRADNDMRHTANITATGAGTVMNINLVSDFENDGNGLTYLGARLWANGGVINVPKAITLTATTDIRGGTGGSLTLGSTVDGAFDFSIGSTPTATFGGAWGAVTPLNIVAVSVSNSFILPTISASSITAGSGGSGNVTIGTLNITGTGDAAFTTGTGNIIANNSINMNGGHLSFTSGTGAGRSVTINQAIAGAGNVTVTTDNPVVNNTIAATNTITFKPRNLGTAVGISGGAGGLNISDALIALLNPAMKLVIGDTAGTGDVDLDSWNLSAKPYAVEVYGNDIDLGGITMGAGHFLAYARDNGVDKGDVTLSANITRGVNGDALLDLRADQQILNSGGADIIATDANSDGDGNPLTDEDKLNIIINADRNRTTTLGGNINFVNATFNTNGGYLTMGGGLTPDSLPSYGDFFTNNGYGLDLNAVVINTGVGAFSALGMGLPDAGNVRYGMRVTGTDIDTSSGTISLNGTGGGTGASSDGLYIVGSTISSATGGITLTGTSTGSGNTNYGVEIENSTVEVTGAGGGNIEINGTSLNAASGGRGVALELTNTISNVDGNITIVGDAAGPTSIDIDATMGGSIINTNGDIVFTGDILNLNKAAAPVTTVGGGAMTGDITFTTNDFTLNNYDVDTTGTITITPKNTATGIGISGGGGALNISDAELGLMSAGTKMIIGSATAGTGAVDLDSWNLAAMPYDVEIYGGSIDLGGVTMGTGDFLAHARNGGDVVLSADITRAVAGTALLDVRADSNIINMAGADILSSVGILDIILNADRNNNDDGYINFQNATISTNGGDFTAGGGTTPATDYAWGNAGQSTGAVFDNTQITTDAGTISLFAHGFNNAAGSSEYGIHLLNGTVIEASTGTITLNGIGGNGVSTNHGIHIVGAGTAIVSADGDITLSGQGGATASGNNNHGILIDTDADIISTNIADIILTGIKGAGTSYDLMTQTGIIDIGESAGDDMLGTITINANSISLADTLLTTDGTIEIFQRTNGTEIGLGSGTTTGGLGLELDVNEMAMLSAATLIFGNSNTGAMQIGDITANADQSYYGTSITIVGDVDAATNTLLLDATTGNINSTVGTLTATTLDLDAATTIVADIDATNVDINNNATGATLTGLVGGAADQAAADAILGGPGNSPAYRFAGFVIRSLGGGGGGGGSAGGGGGATPTVPPTLPEIPPSPVLPSEPGGNTGVPQPQQQMASTIPNTVEITSQMPVLQVAQFNALASELLQEQAEEESEETEGKDGFAKQENQNEQLFAGLVKIHPMLVKLFGLQTDKIQ